jgi:phosphoribosylamine---glycine ligase
MKVLVVGGGGREHAIAWKLAQSPKVQRVYVAPGNAGTARDARLRNVAITGILELAEFAMSEKIGLTVVGPEAPLAAGIVDAFRSRNLRIFGPTRAAAQLESSKAFSKAFMKRHGIPTADFEVFSNAVAAHAYVDQVGAPIVVKADGLAAGKGVVVAATAVEAHRAIDQMLALPHGQGQQPAGGGLGDDAPMARVVIEQVLPGEEASFIVVSDGRHVVPLATSQDHKRLGDGDQGPNTGGMGAYSPAPVVTPNVQARVMREIILPTIHGMAREGMPFTGFLYAGLMIDEHGHPKTLEFNARLGDPETQPILMRLKSDLLDLLLHATAGVDSGTLDQANLQWDRRAALGVVMASHGYPGTVRSGDPISGLPPTSDDAVVFHAGTTLDAQGQVVTSGGRVLCATALGDGVRKAQQRAYELLAPIRFDGAQYRRDIGHLAIRR